MAKLTQSQWNKLKKRLDKGEEATTLAKEFGVTRQAIYKKFGSQKAEIKTVANQIIKASESLNESLHQFTPQVVSAGWDMAADLVSISRQYLAGTKYSAMTFHRMAAIANMQAALIDDSNPGSPESLVIKQVSDAYQDSANKASAPVVRLMDATKDKTLNPPDLNSENEPMSIEDFYSRD